MGLTTEKGKRKLAHLPGNFKVKMNVELLLNDKEAENSSADKLNRSLESAYLPVIGDS